MEKSLKKKFTRKHKIVLGGGWTTNIALIAFNSRLEHARPLYLCGVTNVTTSWHQRQKENPKFDQLYFILFHFTSLPLVRKLSGKLPLFVTLSLVGLGASAWCVNFDHKLTLISGMAARNRETLIDHNQWNLDCRPESCRTPEVNRKKITIILRIKFNEQLLQNVPMRLGMV